jgi:hypothetical protein
MSVFTCVKCDNYECKEQLHRDLMHRPHEWHLPEKWLTVVPGDTQLNEAWHFCSLQCLSLWSAQKGE